MYSLNEFSLREMAECSAALRQLGQGAANVDEVATRTTQYLYTHLGETRTGRQDCALVRFFKTCPYDELDDVAQQYAREALGGAPVSPSMRCLTLLGTAGERPEWNIRERSSSYRAIPLASRQFVGHFPMFSQLLHQFGVTLQPGVEPDADLIIDWDEKTSSVFHVPEAVGSPFVPAQEKFVIPFGIRSVLGFGGMLPSRELFAVVLFSKVRVPRETADLFKPLAMSVRLTVLPFDGRPAISNASGELKQRQSQVETLEQLLQVHEEAVRVQSNKVEKALNELRDRAQALERSENALRQQSGILHSILRSIGDGVVVTDRDGKTVLANPAAEGILGFSPTDIRLSEWTQRFGFYKRDMVTPYAYMELPLVRAIRGEQIDWAEIFLRPLSGFQGRWLSVNARTLRDDTGASLGAVAVFHDITWLKRAESALRESEQRFRHLVEGARDIIVTLSDAGLITSLNPAFESMTHWPRLSCIGQQFATFLHPDDVSEARQLVEEIVSKGTARTCVLRMRIKESGYVVGEFIGAPQLQDGRVVGVLGIARDITERQRIEDALREREALLQAVFERSAVGIALTDLQGRFVKTNSVYQHMLGYTEDELQAVTFLSLTHQDDVERSRRLFLALLNGETPSFQIEKRYRRRNGGYLWVRNAHSLVTGPAGRPQFCIVIVEDITEQKRAEESLRFTQFAVDHAADAILWAGPDMRLLYANEAACRSLGYLKEELLGLTIGDIAPQHDPVAHQERIELLRQIGSLHYESIHRRKAGVEFPIELSVNYFQHNGQEYTCAIARDITERKQAEEELQKSLDLALALSRRLEVVREEERARIARELHDELGVGLTCIKMDLSRLNTLISHASLAPEGAHLQGKIRSMTEFIDSTIAAVQRIVTELRPAVLDDLGLVAAIEWQCQDFQLRTGISCVCVASEEDIQIDPKRATAVFRICQEALANIARHANATEATVHVGEKDGVLVLEVGDNGSGIPDGKISDPQSFGLQGMRERAGLYGGEVSIAGISGRGTTIRVALTTASAV